MHAAIQSAIIVRARDYFGPQENHEITQSVKLPHECLRFGLNNLGLGVENIYYGLKPINANGYVRFGRHITPSYASLPS